MRLDSYLVQEGYFSTRTKAKQAVERGEIYIDSKQVLKSSFDVSLGARIERICEREYVSLGGFKLEKALKDFNFCVKDMVVADVGASTGGFTDCLLKNGAKHVFSIDLRDDLLHDKLKTDKRVTLIVKNAKDLVQSDFSLPLDLIVADLSFISLSSVISTFADLIGDGKKLLLLIKPQFETGQKIKFKNGIIKDKKIHRQVCMNVYNCAINYNLAPIDITTAPIVDGKNTEFLILLEKGGKVALPNDFAKNI